MGQDVLALVPGRPNHDDLANSVRRRDRINAGMVAAERMAAVGKGAIPPGACVLCGAFPEGSLVTESTVAGLGNLDL